MALKYLDGGRITGLSTDAKPTDIPTGSSFIETDSGRKLVYNGTRWFQQPFESINEALGNSNGVTQRQHFVEWFTGRSLNTERWTYAGITGSPTSAMADSANGGYQITGVANNNAAQITFNGKDEFTNHSVFIAVAKKSQSAAAVMGGFRTTSGSTINPTSSTAQFHNNSGYTNIALVTGDASAVSAAESSTPHDQAYHCFKIDLSYSSGTGTMAGSPNTTLTLDGVLAITKSTNQPTDGYVYQPALCFQQRSSTNANGNFLYCEAYNK